MACLWLLHYNKEIPYKNRLLNKLSLAGNKIRVPFFILTLSVGAIGGLVSYVMDLKYPFSTSEQAALYIQEHELDNHEIIGSKDYIISPLATQLGKKILYAERKEKGSFIIYDQKRTNIWSFSEVQSTIHELHNQGHKQIILVKSSPILMTFDDTGESIPWEEGELSDLLVMKLLTTIHPGIVQDEVYYIYSIEEAGK